MVLKFGETVFHSNSFTNQENRLLYINYYYATAKLVKLNVIVCLSDKIVARYERMIKVMITFI